MNAKDSRPVLEVWLTNADDAGLKFIEYFEKYMIEFSKDLLMIPRYFHWSCLSCTQDIINSSCVCNGKYCGMHDVSNFNGKDVVMEDLR